MTSFTPLTCDLTHSPINYDCGVFGQPGLCARHLIPFFCAHFCSMLLMDYNVSGSIPFKPNQGYFNPQSLRPRHEA